MLVTLSSDGLREMSRLGMFQRCVHPLAISAALCLLVFQSSKAHAAGTVQTATGTSSNSTSVSATFSTTPVAGNLLVAIAANPSAYSSVTPPAGWTLGKDNLNATPGQIIYYKIAGASESKTVTFSGYDDIWFNSDYHALQIMELNGYAGLPVTGAATANGGLFGDTLTYPSVTTVTDSAVVLTASVNSGSLIPLLGALANAFSSLANFTLGSERYIGAYKIVGAAGSYNTSQSIPAFCDSLGQTIAFSLRPGGSVTNLSVTSSTTTNKITMTAPAAPLTSVLVVAKTGDCTFTGTPTGSEVKGGAVGNGVVIFSDPVTAILGSTNVTVGGKTTTVTYDVTTNTLTHGSLTAGTLYCYKAFARNGTALDYVTSDWPSRSGTPTTGATTDPLFMVGSGNVGLAAPSVIPGTGAFYAATNGKVMKVRNGIPAIGSYTLPNGVQSRGPAGTLTGDTESTLFLSSLNGEAYAIWASGSNLGTMRWSTVAIDGGLAVGDQALGDALYAAPLVSNTLTRVFVGTRNLTGSQNRVYGLNATTGACQWVFNGDCSGTVGTSNVGQISAIPILDAANYRLFFTSTKLNTGSTAWALDAHDSPSGSRILWQRDLGDSDSAMTFLNAARTSVLVSTTAGRIYHLSASTGATCWGSTGDGCNTATGTEEFFCTSSGVRASSCSSGVAVVKSMITLQGAYTGYFAFTTTDGYVRLVNANGVQQWRTMVAGASAPLVLTTVGKMYVGGSDGLVHELAISNGVQSKTQNAGGTGVTVGEPSYDGTDNVLYVNTTQGNQYAFTVPF